MAGVYTNGQTKTRTEESTTTKTTAKHSAETPLWQSKPSNHIQSQDQNNNTEKVNKRTGSAVRRPSHARSVTAKSKKAKATGVTAAHERPRQTAVVRATEGRAVSGHNESPDRTQKGRKKGEHRYKHRQRTNGQRINGGDIIKLHITKHRLIVFGGGDRQKTKGKNKPIQIRCSLGRAADPSHDGATAHSTAHTQCIAEGLRFGKPILESDESQQRGSERATEETETTTTTAKMCIPICV